MLGPAAMAERAATAARLVWPGEAVDFLPYGRSSEDIPVPAGLSVIRLPSFSGSAPRRVASTLAWTFRLRRRGYRLGVLVAPALARSRMRGPLLLFPFLLGAAEVQLVGPLGDRARRVPFAVVLADFVRWSAWQPLSACIALCATAAARPISRRPPPPVVRVQPQKSGAVYLRTDIELAATPLTAGGSLAHTDGILCALARRGLAVEFWCTGQISGLTAPVEHRVLPVFGKGNVPTEIAELLSSMAQSAKPLRAHAPPAFVYQRYSLHNFTGLLLARRWRVPLILEANASEVAWRDAWSAIRFPRLARASERLLLSRADRIAAVSDNAAEDLIAAGADPGRVVVVPNGADVERIAAAAPLPLPFAPDALVIGFVGLFYPWHGVRHLAAAFVRLSEVLPHARLVLVGDGEEAPHVRAMLAEAGLDGSVHMPGLVAPEEVPRYLAAADILVSPHAPIKRFIGSPVKIFEYMASGRAIVASDVAQIGEILTHRESALLVPGGDDEALAAALLELGRNANLRRRLGRTAQAEARLDHSWDARLARILASADAVDAAAE